MFLDSTGFRSAQESCKTRSQVPWTRAAQSPEPYIQEHRIVGRWTNHLTLHWWQVSSADARECPCNFYQRVSIASYASAGIARGGMSVCPSVCPSVRLSVTLRYCIKMKKASVMISSLSDSLNILVSRNIWFITKFDRGRPERGRFLRLRYELAILAIFRPINRRISETVQDRIKVAVDH